MFKKAGKVIIKKDGINYEIKEKDFFRSEVEGVYYVSGSFLERSACITINLNRLVESIEFINCNFEYLSNRGKNSLTLVAYCPVKIINSKIENNMNIIIDDEQFDVEVTNYKSKVENTLKITSTNAKLTDIVDTTIDIKSENTNILNYTATGGKCNILAMYLSLKNTSIIQASEINITSVIPIEWSNTKISSTELYIHGLINSYKIKKEQPLYEIDDNNINEMLVRDKLYSVLRGIEKIIDNKKTKVKSLTKEQIDAEIKEAMRHIQELEQKRRTTIDKIDNEMSKQKVYSYIKNKEEL